MILKTYTKLSPVRDYEFSILIEKSKKLKRFMEYNIAYSFAYHCGFGLKDIEKFKHGDLNKIDLPDNFDDSWIQYFPLKVNRRSLQRNIKKILGKSFLSLKVGFILKKLNQGYSLEYISRKLNYSDRYKENNLIKQFIRNKITHKKRLQVLERDGFKCVYCGRGYPDVELHVDHITPLSKKGKSNMGNLQTLCDTCNRGKTDWEIPEHNQKLSSKT